VLPIKSISLTGQKTVVLEKVKESALSVLPVVIIVIVLCLTVSPVDTDLLLCFLLGAVMLVVGMGFFSLGADTAMSRIGSRIGTALTSTKKLPLILAVSFLLGFAVTVAEPDLQVLANTVPHINSTVLLVTVGVGVGFFLSMCMLRIITGIKLRYMLLVCYALLFILAFFTDSSFLGIAFDSGGVTTGPMTVPFILAFGMGVAHIRSDKNAEADSFGLVALSSVGPILSVLILGFFYPQKDGVADLSVAAFGNTAEIGVAYLKAIPAYMKETAMSLLPVMVIFLIFQLALLKLERRTFCKILIGVLYTYIGLVLFLTGVNVGFSPLGSVLGQELATGNTKYLLIPLAMLIGWFIISAEPAVAVLEKQIEEVSAGAIPGKAIKISLSVAVSLALGMSMLRVLTGISLMWFLVPGYAIALILSFFVPDIYTAIAFDSGGVASGPMTAAFILQFVMGASSALGGDILSDAFGVVALVAMMPLISIQIVGFIFEHRTDDKTPAEIYGDYDIIELWEDAV
jgi:intracellular septation protein A